MSVILLLGMSEIIDISELKDWVRSRVERSKVE